MFDHKQALGVPRWKEREHYPDAENQTDLQWRWEFLRRRPDYREAWTKNYDQCQARYDRLYGEGLIDDRERYRSTGTTMRAICEPFFVDRIDAPWLEKPHPHLWRLPYGWALGEITENISVDSLVEQSQLREKNGQMLIAFDLNRPFDEQLLKVRAFFEAVQSETHGSALVKNRHHKRKWANYLRAIDARDQGATYENLFIELELSHLPTSEYDAALDKNLAASGLQLWRQAHDLMFKVTS